MISLSNEYNNNNNNNALPLRIDNKKGKAGFLCMQLRGWRVGGLESRQHIFLG